MKQYFSYDRRKKSSITNQIIDQIISYINDFKLISGNPLPDVQTSAKNLGLSKKDVDEVLKALETKGYLVYHRQQGQYLVHKPSKDSNFINSISPLYTKILQQGKTPHITTLEKKKVTTDQELAQRTGFGLGEPLIRYRRSFTADKKPIMVMDLYLSLKYLPKADQTFLDHQPHLDIMMKTYSSQYQYHVRELNAIIVPDWVKKILNIKEEGAICIYGDHRFYNPNGHQIEFGTSYLSDLTEFTTQNKDLNQLFI